MKTLAKWLALLSLMSSTALATPAEKQKACEAGDAKACLDLGDMYAQGQGVEKSPSKAFDLFKNACDGGDAYGCNNLGWMYQKGEGVEKSLSKAAELYKKACDGGMALSCSSLADPYTHLTLPPICRGNVSVVAGWSHNKD